MKSLWYLSCIVSVVSAVARLAPPDGAIVVAKSGGDFDLVCLSWTRHNNDVDNTLDWTGNHFAEC